MRGKKEEDNIEILNRVFREGLVENMNGSEELKEGEGEVAYQEEIYMVCLGLYSCNRVRETGKSKPICCCQGGMNRVWRRDDI